MLGDKNLAALKGSNPGFEGAEACQDKALYVGNLHSSVSLDMLQEVFSSLGPIEEIRIIKDKLTGLSAGYGFVRYLHSPAAELARQLLNGAVLHGLELRVRWALQKDHKDDGAHTVQIFVGGLASDVNDKLLFSGFLPFGCTDARVMWDHYTGQTKGYGFVTFKSRKDAEKAIAHMTRAMLGSQRIRCGWAQHRQETFLTSCAAVDRAEPYNTNVYIGNIGAEVTDVELKQLADQCGVVVDLRLHRKGGYAFVQYASHAEAVRTIVSLSGLSLKGSALKCSWARRKAQTSGRIKTPSASLALGAGADLFGLLLQQDVQQVGIQQQLAMQLYGYSHEYQPSLGTMLGISQQAQHLVPTYEELNMLTLGQVEEQLALYDIPTCLGGMHFH